MATTEAQARATQKYISTKDQIRVFVPRDVGAKIRLAAETQGVPLATFISESALARIDRVDVSPVSIEGQGRLALLRQECQEAYEKLDKANKEQEIAYKHFLSCADALKKAIEEV